MKKLLWGGLLVMGVSPVGAVTHSILIDTAPTTFLTTGNEELVVTQGTSVDELDTRTALMPNLNIGYEFNQAKWRLAVTAGGGRMFVEPDFEADFSQLDIGLFYRVSDAVAIGPHLSGLYFDPDYYGADLAMDDDWALAPGVSFVAGGRGANFKMSLDYMKGADIALSGTNGTTVTDKNGNSVDNISMDGWIFRIGMLIRMHVH